MNGKGRKKLGAWLFGPELPQQNTARRPGFEVPALDRSDDIEVCRKVVGLDPAVRVAAVVEGDEVTAFAQSDRASSVLGNDRLFRTKIGYWVRILTEIAAQTAQLFGATESISVTHNGLRLVTLPLSRTRSLGLSLERSSDVDYIVSKIAGAL